MSSKSGSSSGSAMSITDHSQVGNTHASSNAHAMSNENNAWANAGGSSWSGANSASASGFASASAGANAGKIHFNN